VAPSVMNMTCIPNPSEDDARFIFQEWDRRARTRDTPGLLELYTDDAVLESPLVPRIRAAPEGDQVDIAEVMDLRGPRIAVHRIYWGWFGTEMLIANAVGNT
jgi:hypothetical protein